MSVLRTIAIVAACVGFALGRIVMEPHGVSREDVFKDFAHLWVGGLFGAAWLGWVYRSSDAGLRRTAARLFWAGVALTVVEVVVAISHR